MKRLLLLSLLACHSPYSSALNIQLDYTYDSLGFFSGGNLFRRDVMEAAANVFEQRLSDEFTAITSINDGFNNFQFNSIIERPDTGATVSGPTSIAADTVIVYVGGTNLLSATTLGEAGPLGFQANVSGDPALFQDWFDNVYSRGQGDGRRAAVQNLQGELPAFETALWGGKISFNSTANWYFDDDPATDESFAGNDFYSVALHEIAHVLGVGTADAWFNLIDFNNGLFTGNNASLSNGGSVPLADNGHFGFGVTSTVDGASQEVAMDPDLTQGTRKRLTDLDWAALEDIGWQVAEPVIETPDPVSVPTLGVHHVIAFALLICSVASITIRKTYARDGKMRVSVDANLVFPS